MILRGVIFSHKCLIYAFVGGFLIVYARFREKQLQKQIERKIPSIKTYTRL